MFESFWKVFDLSDLNRSASEAQALALVTSSSDGLLLSDISSNLSILVNFMGQIVRFLTTTLGWLGGWGVLLLVASFLALSLVNFLSPFKKANYGLVLLFISLYGYSSGVPLVSLIKFAGLMLLPVLLGVVLYGSVWLWRHSGRPKKEMLTAPKIRERRHVRLRVIRQGHR